LKKISKNISIALKKMGNYIKKVSKENEIIFQTGDDMLILGKLSFNDLVKIKQIYKDTTEILTCSIGFGKTSKDAYMALKLAKANPQKNMIKGIYFNN
jgi:c-di-AMP phosphodiesterase-like protein